MNNFISIRDFINSLTNTSTQEEKIDALIEFFSQGHLPLYLSIKKIGDKVYFSKSAYQQINSLQISLEHTRPVHYKREEEEIVFYNSENKTTQEEKINKFYSPFHIEEESFYLQGILDFWEYDTKPRIIEKDGKKRFFYDNIIRQYLNPHFTFSGYFEIEENDPWHTELLKRQLKSNENHFVPYTDFVYCDDETFMKISLERPAIKENCFDAIFLKIDEIEKLYLNHNRINILTPKDRIYLTAEQAEIEQLKTQLAAQQDEIRSLKLQLKDSTQARKLEQYQGIISALCYMQHEPYRKANRQLFKNQAPIANAAAAETIRILERLANEGIFNNEIKSEQTYRKLFTEIFKQLNLPKKA